jgi:hypothetical protein
MTPVIIAIVAVALLALFVFARSRAATPQNRLKLPTPKRGEKIGSWKLEYFPEARQLWVQIGMPSDRYLQFVVYYISWQIDYFSSGDPKHDDSGALRSAIQQALDNPGVSAWTIVSERGKTEPNSFSYEGELYEASIDKPGFIGSVDFSAKTESLIESCRALTVDILQRGGSEAKMCHDALTLLLNWHEQYGPVRYSSLGDAVTSARPHAALTEARKPLSYR